MAYRIESISFSYEDKKIIDRLSLEIAPGRFYGVIGPNGCGKSTLLDLLARHREPAEGCIRYKGKRLEEFSRRQLSREIALVPQNFYINFPFTSEEVVMMGRYPHIPRFSRPAAKDLKKVEAVMRETGTDRFRKRYITELSGGERQRVVIARALAQDTPFLLLDEATSNLDINHSLRLFNMAKEGIRGESKTVVAVMQDVNLAALFCDALIFMRDGRIVACGPVAEVLTPETLHSVFDVEAKVYFEPYSQTHQVALRR
ncbi:MAG: ABC transporter ATP-binding protein [Desulfobacteraceae bacterium]|nr:MAG: ABC transporter ATP-binding protein [Desulfobacteraceae bacterium]